MQNNPNAQTSLIRILQNAHAGECAAAFAYRGHWKSLKDSPEKDGIRRIEAEEWDHRERVKRWLDHFGAKPRPLREAVFWTIGRTLGPMCFVSGRFMPMYFAGRLESQNILEYAEAAEYAALAGLPDCEADLLDMSRVEAEHELYFRQKVQDHFLMPLMKTVFRWG
jgi:rubrerythrin